MALTKLVNGERVKLSTAEEKAVKAEWAANDKAAKEQAKRHPIEDAIDQDPIKKVLIEEIAKLKKVEPSKIVASIVKAAGKAQ